MMIIGKMLEFSSHDPSNVCFQFLFFSLPRGRFPRPFGFAFLVHEQLLFWGAHEFLGSTVCTGRMDDMLEKMQVCWFPLCSCGLVLANFIALGARFLLASFSANAVLFVFTLHATGSNCFVFLRCILGVAESRLTQLLVRWA